MSEFNEADECGFNYDNYNAADEMPQIGDVPPAMLERYFQKLFKIADLNGDGVLQPDELSNMLSGSGFKLTPSQVQQVVEAADVNNDGVIDYEEFVPIAVAVLKGQTGMQGEPAPLLENLHDVHP